MRQLSEHKRPMWFFPVAELRLSIKEIILTELKLPITLYRLTLHSR